MTIQFEITRVHEFEIIFTLISFVTPWSFVIIALDKGLHVVQLLSEEDRIKHP